MKPIEPGCKAMIISNGGNPDRDIFVGLVVDVFEFIGFDHVEPSCWKTSMPIMQHKYTAMRIAERCLMRIDDDARLTEIESISLEA